MARMSDDERRRRNAERKRQIRTWQKECRTAEKAGRPPPPRPGRGAKSDPAAAPSPPSLTVDAQLEELSGEALREAKTREEILGLRLKREKESGKLIDAAEAGTKWLARLTAHKSAVDACPARYKMRRPDATPEDLAALRECLDDLVQALKSPHAAA